jgi:hypothetical protein
MIGVMIGVTCRIKLTSVHPGWLPAPWIHTELKKDVICELGRPFFVFLFRFVCLDFDSGLMATWR